MEARGALGTAALWCVRKSGSGISSHVYKKLKFISITAGGLHKINVSGEPTSRLDVDKNELTATYQDWSREARDIDFTSDYSKAVIAIRDTADSTTRELKESISTQKSFVAANSKELTF